MIFPLSLVEAVRSQFTSSNMRPPWEGLIGGLRNIPKIVQFEGHHPLKRRMNFESSQQQGHIEDISFGQDIGEYLEPVYRVSQICHVGL